MYKYLILCHELYIILITNFQYLMKFIYNSNVLCHHEIHLMSFYVMNYI